MVKSLRVVRNYGSQFDWVAHLASPTENKILNRYTMVLHCRFSN